MRFVGIDVGLSGAIALLDVGEHGIIRWALHDMPLVKQGKRHVIDVTALASLLMKEIGRCANTTIVVEKVSAMPKQGVVSMFRFGESFGIVQGVLSGLQLSYILIAPQTWKKAVMPHMPHDKNASIIVAKRLYPECSDSLNLKRHHGRADALLLAHHGRIRLATPTPILESVGVALPF